MSLNWNASKVANMAAIGVGLLEAEMTPDQRIEWAKTEHIIWSMLVVGLGAITEKNVDDAYERLSAYERAMENVVTTISPTDVSGVKHYLTLEDIRKRIGLTTNVTQTTRAAFERRLGQILLDEAKYRLNHQKKAEGK